MALTLPAWVLPLLHREYWYFDFGMLDKEGEKCIWELEQRVMILSHRRNLYVAQMGLASWEEQVKSSLGILGNLVSGW